MNALDDSENGCIFAFMGEMLMFHMSTFVHASF